MNGHPPQFASYMHGATGVATLGIFLLLKIAKWYRRSKAKHKNEKNVASDLKEDLARPVQDADLSSGTLIRDIWSARRGASTSSATSKC